MKTRQTVMFFVLLSFLSVGLFGDETPQVRPDVLIADFESDNYANWKLEGDAFGSEPAKGTLPGQMSVSGFEGKQLVNSFHNGDGSVGKLTSPAFKIERKYITFLIGGGAFEDETCMRLLIDGKRVRQATGDNTQPGGSEKLDWKCWDVAKFLGKTATIEIVDDARGGWGHVNVDQIAQSDTAHGPVETSEPKVSITREITIQKPFLHLPVKTGSPQKWLQLVVGDKVVREFTLEIANENDKPDFYGTMNVTAWQGKKATLIVDKMPKSSKSLDAVKQSDEMSDEATVYTEKYRPRYHYTVRRGWINDPNGLLYYAGEYHMFSQHNPFGVNWENMSWAHAVSKDLVHWTEMSDAIVPDELGTMFSGSGVVDHANTSGFQTGDDKPLVLIYTAAGGTNRLSKGKPFTQGIAFSNDRGRTWAKYDGNPVLAHIEGGNRDPKVFWHKPSNQWVMALYLDREDYALFGSPNLKEWSQLCDIKKLGCSECPDMFELAVDGDANNKKWVFWGGNGMYLVGSFDGKTFKPESKPLAAKYGGSDYAAQCWSDIPEKDGRRLQIAWMNNWGNNKTFFPNMPFNQQYTVPRELTLRTTKDGIRLFTNPVGELQGLRLSKTPAMSETNLAVKNGKEMKTTAPDRAMEIELTLNIGTAKKIELAVPGHNIVYDVAAKKLGPMPLEPVDGKIKLRIYTDIASVEYFANDGIVQFAQCFAPEDVKSDTISITAQEGDATLETLTVWSLKSAWQK